MRILKFAIVCELLLILFTTACAPRQTLSVQEQAARALRVEELITKATLLLREGDEASLKIAHSSLLLARELSPRNARISDGFGCIAWRRGRFESAERFFLEAMRYDQAYDRAYAHAALAAERRGDREKAKELYQTAISLSPLNYRTRNNYAATLFDSDRSAVGRFRANRQLQMAVQASPVVDDVLGRNLGLMTEQ